MKYSHLQFSRLLLGVITGSLLFVVIPVIAADEPIIREQSLEARKVLTQATILQKSGKTTEAIALLKQKFPNGPPSGDLAIAYFRIISVTPEGLNYAKNGLRAFIKSDPKNWHYQLALASLLVQDQSTRSDGLQLFEKLSKASGVNKQRVLQAWREFIVKLEVSPESIQYLDDYLKADPLNQDIQGRLLAMRQAVAERKRIAADPVLSKRQEGLDYLDKGAGSNAEPILLEVLKALPNDPQTIGALGLIRLKQGRQQEAVQYFQKALELNPENSAKWNGLIITSRYWQLIREAANANGNKNYALAEDKARAAIKVDAEGAEALAQLGQSFAGKDQAGNAEKYYRDALQIESDNDTAMRGLITLYIKMGRREEATALMASLNKTQQVSPNKFNYLRLQLLREEADSLIAKGESREALNPLKTALSIEPSNPWLRLRLADLSHQVSGSIDGLAIMKEGMKLSPRDPEMVNAMVIYLNGIDQDEQALRVISEYLSKNTKAPISIQLTYVDLLNRLLLDDQLATALATLGKRNLVGADKVQLQRVDLSYQARVALKEGNSERAITLMKKLLTLDENNVWLRYDLARLYAAKGLPNNGVDLFDIYFQRHQANGESLYAYSLYLSNIESYEKSLKILEKIPLGDRSQKITKFQRELWLRAQLFQFQALIKKNPSTAKQRLILIESQVANDPDLSAKLALAWLRVGDPDRAAQIFLDAQKNNLPLSIEWHLEYARYLLNGNQDKAFEGQMSALSQKQLDQSQLRETAQLQEEHQLKNVDQYIKAGELDQANQMLAPLVKQNPKNYSALSLMSQIQRRQGLVDQSINTEQYALANIPVPLSTQGSLSSLKLVDSGSHQDMSIYAINPPSLKPSAIDSGSNYQYKQVAELLDSRANWLSTAFDYLSLSGTPGQSSYQASEIPLEWRMPFRSDEVLTFRADQVNINAGSIDLSNSYQTSTFGSMALCQPDCSSSLTQQSAAGTALNMGYAKQGLKVDVGTTPIGFLVQNFIGGIRQKGDIGPVGFVVDINRRPVTSTMLSYAGTRDPRTGSIWGGVVATGGSVGFSLDKGETLGAWTTYRARSLTGMNVQSNSDNQFMAGLNWRIINEDNRLLTSGLTGMLWAFKTNAGQFTYGQGGYYSPQSYRSITLPLSYSHRLERFSYVLSGTLTSNWSRTDSAPYYPTNADYQSAAGNPYYGASSGPGSAYSMLAGWEYEVTPSLFVGNRLKLERSPYYAPNSFVVYLRLNLDHVAAQPVMLQVQPVIPTSRF